MTCEDCENDQEGLLLRLAIRLSGVLHSERSRKFIRYIPRQLRMALATIFLALHRTLNA